MKALDGYYDEQELPLLIQRRGMVEWRDGKVRLLDRRRLPHETVFVDCDHVEEVAKAIEDMLIQGATTLSIAGGYGLALAAQASEQVGGSEARWRAIDAAASRLQDTRPTGLALRRLLERGRRVARTALDRGADPTEAILEETDAAAARIARAGYEVGRHTNELVPDGARILTHCFADRALLYTLLAARADGKDVSVYCSETRPYLQGARLTSLSITQLGLPCTLITDSMGGFLFQRGLADMLITAADRVCMDGSVCNKVGTYQHALAARANAKPFYVSRAGGPDTESAGAEDVEIEMRDADEVLSFAGDRIAPHGVDALYPAFDITPPELVTRIVTDAGSFAPDELANYREPVSS